MRGVILAGGNGTRLLPLTETINKHLLPVGQEPMIFHPIRQLVEAGVDEILVVTGGNCPDGFLTLLKDGSQLGVKNLYYAYQQGAGGIAEALKLAEKFVGEEDFVVVLGDNIFTGSLKEHVKNYIHRPGVVGESDFAQVFLYKVEDPRRFGCPKFDDFDNLVEIVEKPSVPDSDYAVVGIYFYPHSVFTKVLPDLIRSARGELEITAVNNYYVKKNKLRHAVLDGQWSDAGTWPSYAEANKIVSDDENSKV
jgi:glucose-1-phosphate thymidylyltransferase